jgi:hypothetical protein
MRSAHGLRVQAKLTVGRPDDEYEREADQVADAVIRDSDEPPARRIGSSEENQGVQSKAGAPPPSTVPAEVESQIASARGGGRPLSDSTRNFFEPRIGTDLTDVRVHDDAAAADSARAISAHAFTVGSDIFFGTGKYSPTTTDGKRLLGHELVHTLQQGGSRARRVQRQPDEKQGIEAELKPSDESDVVLLLTAVERFGSLRATAEPIGGISNARLAKLEQQLVALWNLTTGITNAGGELSPAQWDAIRADIEAVGKWARANGIEVGGYREGLAQLDAQFVDWHSNRVIEAGAATADLGDPGDVYKNEIAKQIQKAATAALLVYGELKKEEAKGDKQLLDQGASSAKVVGAEATSISPGTTGKDMDLAPGGPRKPTTGASAAKGSLEMVAKGLAIVGKFQTIDQQLEGLNKSGLKYAASLIDLVTFVADSVKSIAHYTEAIMAARFAGTGSRLKAFVDTLDLNFPSGKLKAYNTTFGYVTAVAGVAVGTLDLIHAINEGKASDAIRAGGTIATGAVNIGGTIVGASAVGTAAVTGVITIWVEGVIAMGELGTMLRQNDLEAKGQRVLTMVNDASAAAATGREMAGAWGEAQLMKLTSLENPASSEARAVDMIEEKVVAMIRGPLIKQINGVRAQLGRFAEDDDVDAKTRSEVQEHLNAFAGSFGVDAFPPIFSELCRTVFADVNSVTRSISKALAEEKLTLPMENQATAK